MVAKSLKGGMVALIVALVLLLPFSFPPAMGQGLGEEGEYGVQEQYRIELNEVGDASITDTITYDPDWFDEYGFLFEENPNLLSRRYRADSNTGEVENFEVDIDSGDATITVTFDTPGLAYNMPDGWTLFGYGDYELTDEGDDEITLAAAWTITNEFSLFEPMGLEEEVTIILPEGAASAGYDEATGAIKYDLTYTPKGSGVLADNKILFTILFAMIMAVSLILMLYLFTRRTQAPAAVETAAAGIPAGSAQIQTSAPQTDTAEAQASATGGETAPSARFCKKCGHPRGGQEERFCRKCGAAHT